MKLEELQSKITPLPWSIHRNEIVHWRTHPETGTPQPQLVATLANRTEAKHNAAYICHACNHFPALVEALERCCAVLELYPPLAVADDPQADAINLAHSTLAAAKELQL